ncbi:MAG: ATP-binding protein [Symploca sp. SIO2E6]|nr:ATP-binding protein [Symploca sp. SIO2E6]
MSDLSHPRLLSFTLDSWTVLGGRVTLDLTDGVGVLVGRNGVGKSAILEGLHAISSFATGRFIRIPLNDYASIPKILEILIRTPTSRQLKYKYEFIPTLVNDGDADEDDSDDSNSEEVSWNDCCQYADGQEELLWTTEAGVTTLYTESSELGVLFFGGTFPFGQVRHKFKSLPISMPAEMEWVFDVLRGIRILGKTPVRKTSRRSPSLLKVSPRGVHTEGALGFRLADSLAKKILRRLNTGELDEFESVCQRVGIGRKITEKKFVLSQAISSNHEKEDEEYISSVLLDETNIGLLSDGTLRILSILIEIMNSSATATTIIEEPELQIHPGMLSKLLAEIETYTFGENLIISTHSPQVVSWTDPQKIHLVYRSDGQTLVRKLGEDEIQKVVEYLCEEGNLGDWIYSGVLDE